jgi:ATP-dependent exoDNAse (exonuclease V) beta subunit
MEKHILALESSDAKLMLEEDDDIEEKALELAIEELYEATERKWKPWANNARAIRMGDIILLVDSDTVVPEVSVSLQLNLIIPIFYFICFFKYRIALGMLHGNWPKVLMLLSFNTNQASL